MSTLLRTLRGIVSMGLTWGVAWAALGVVYGLVRPEQVDAGEGALAIARILGTAGFISGAGFALMLSLLERGRSVLDISLTRVALWGVVGGSIIPLLTQVHDSQVFWTCPLGESATRATARSTAAAFLP